MYIWKDTQKRCNPFANYTDADGTFYLTVPVELYEEIQEPIAPADYSDNFYYKTEQDEAPYVVYTRKSDEQIASYLIQQAKVSRQAIVDSIIVTTTSGKQFDGDETSQGRMARAVVSMEPLETTTWILADNSVSSVTREELKEALRLSGIAQTAVWASPYTL